MGRTGCGREKDEIEGAGADALKAADWRESIIADDRTSGTPGVAVRTIAELTTAPRRLIDEVYFEGLDVLRCSAGRFRFSFTDRDPIDLAVGEMLVVYPRHRVTIDALDGTNSLIYGIFVGKDVESYFDGLGYFDGAKGRVSAHAESIAELRRQLECGGAAAGHGRHCLSVLTDVLVTQWQELRGGGPALAFNAVKAIHQNLLAGEVRLEPLCARLGCSRSYLHRAFLQAGLGSPSAFIRNAQLRMAQGLLVNTRKPVADVARQSGFLSPVHFTAFFRRMTGRTPSQFRKSPDAAP